MLRKFTGVGFFVNNWERLCLGNTYTTTIHAVNSCILKMSKIQVAFPVFRGLVGKSLPEMFWKKCAARARVVPTSSQGDHSLITRRGRNRYRVAGGVEYGFLSTSIDRAQAAHYATGKASTILEMPQGSATAAHRTRDLHEPRALHRLAERPTFDVLPPQVIDRGADVSWLSQYSHEQEVLFPPLTGIQAIGTRVDGRTLVVETRLSLNLMALTLEQVVSKRQKLLQSMNEGTVLELQSALAAAVGTHPGIHCSSSFAYPILGERYQRLGDKHVSISAVENAKLSAAEQAEFVGPIAPMSARNVEQLQQ